MWMLAADFTPYTAGGSALALLAVAIGFNFKNQRELGKTIKRHERENRICNRRLGLIFQVAVENGWRIPLAFWNTGEEDEDGKEYGHSEGIGADDGQGS